MSRQRPLREPQQRLAAAVRAGMVHGSGVSPAARAQPEVTKAMLRATPLSSGGGATVTTLANLPATAALGALFYVTDATC